MSRRNLEYRSSRSARFHGASVPRMARAAGGSGAARIRAAAIQSERSRRHSTRWLCSGGGRGYYLRDLRITLTLVCLNSGGFIV